jgi:hypothetical protein
MVRRLGALVDVMRVPAAGDPLQAVVDVSRVGDAQDVETEVLVVGGGTGGVAAAWAASRWGRRVCLLEETDWIGGQLTAQGVSALDEHDYIESFGGTRTYYRLRELIRGHYRALDLVEPARSRADLNPGNCWVTRLSFEPRVALRALHRFLDAEAVAGRLGLFLRSKVAAVEARGDRIVSLLAVNLDSRRALRFRPEIVIDATELGDLLPLSGAEHVVGAEAKHETGEPHAQPVEAKRHCVQSFTYTFALERRPAEERHVIPRPDRYAHYRESQPYTLRIHVHGGEIYSEESGWLDYQVFERGPGTKGSLWTYRRLVDRELFRTGFPSDISMLNWPGNDYRDASILDRPAVEVARALQDAKRVSLGFLYWLQTEAPNPPGRPGFPQLKLRPDIMGSEDGLSKHPYIRESRRIKALGTVLEQEVSADYQPGPRAAHFPDSVGVGWYPIDIHRAGEEDVGVSCRTRPFQIPLGALIPVGLANLLAASKNIGTTHITNGCYRLHPVEWNTGEAAGALAAFALESRRTPRAVREMPALLRAFQRRLAGGGVPLYWFVDVPVSHPAFAATQLLAMAGVVDGVEGTLEFRPEAPVSKEQRSLWIERALGQGRPDPGAGEPMTRAAFARLLDQLISENAADPDHQRAADP